MWTWVAIDADTKLVRSWLVDERTIQDCYAGWRYYPEFSLRVGQFKEPFGQEQTSPDRFLDFDERSEGDKFTPQRDLGIGAYGTLAGGLFTYELGYFNGQLPSGCLAE